VHQPWLSFLDCHAFHGERKRLRQVLGQIHHWPYKTFANNLAVCLTPPPLRKPPRQELFFSRVSELLSSSYQNS
jgi:hypothetical protein